jgi:cobalt/nickel transport system permease protein
MAHIPDGFLSAAVSATTLVAAGAVTAYAARRSQKNLDERAAPTLGLATAAVFAAQAVNFPVAAGTSGHLLGGVLVAVLFGPWAGYLVMTAVLIVQALIFADGGLTALGANVLNIAGIGALVGYGIYRALTALAGEGARRRGLAAAAAAYVATVLTGVAAGWELGLSGVAPIRLSVGAMAGVHAVVGLAEGAITATAVWALTRKRPDLLYQPRAPATGRLDRAVVVAALGSLAIVVGLLSLVASAAPDGLKRAAIDLGFADAATAWESAPFGNYRAWLPGPAGTAVALVLGIALLFAGAAATFRVMVLARRAREGRG